MRLNNLYKHITYDDGYEAPSTEGINIDEAEFETLEVDETEIKFGDTKDTIELEVSIQSKQIQDQHTQIQLIKNDEVLLSHRVYNPHLRNQIQVELSEKSKCSEIELISQIGGETQTIFKKEFLSQSAPTLNQRLVINEDYKITTPNGHQQGLVNVTPIYTYGGLFERNKTKLVHIGQVFFTIGFEGNNTIPSYQTLPFLRKQGVFKDRDPKSQLKAAYFVVDKATGIKPSTLAEDIHSGKIIFSQSNSSGIIQDYQSFNYEQNENLTDKVIIKFKPILTRESV